MWSMTPAAIQASEFCWPDGVFLKRDGEAGATRELKQPAWATLALILLRCPALAAIRPPLISQP